MSSDARRGAMVRGGYSFHPPRFAADRAVAFFMTDVEGGQLFEVRAARAAGVDVDADVDVEIAVKPAGRG